MRIKISIASFCYLIPLVLYGVFMYSHAPDDIKLLGCVNSIFILGVDMLIWSLNERHYDSLEN